MGPHILSGTLKRWPQKAGSPDPRRLRNPQRLDFSRKRGQSEGLVEGPVSAKDDLTLTQASTGTFSPCPVVSLNESSK